MKKNKYYNSLIIFDFDGVLVNSIKVMEIAWKEANRKIRFEN